MKLANLEDNSLPEPNPARLRKASRALKSNTSFAIGELKYLASQGSLLSLLQLGSVYSDDKLVDPDLEQAEAYFRRAADGGALIGHYLLGRLFLTQRRHEDALRAFSYASGKGYPPAIHYLGRMYLQGRGVTADHKRAKELFSRAAERGSVAAKLGLSTILMQHRTSSGDLWRAVWLRMTGIPQFLFTIVTEGYSSDRLR